MKKILPLAAAAIMLAACASKPTALEKVLSGEPIMPIRPASDSTRIYLTDYLPTLDAKDFTHIDATGAYSIHPADDGEYDLKGRCRYVEFVRVSDGKNTIAIPIIPRHSYYQGLTSLAASKTSITIGFTGAIREEVKNPLIVCMVQNCVLAQECLTANEDSTWTLDLKEALKPYPALRHGRAYLRIFASDKYHLYNDLLIPLNDGLPILRANQLNRHDVNTQVLYSLMVDRFCNGNPDNDRPLNRPDVLPQVDYMGGDIKGITKKIEEGFFDELGISTIWISPLSQNPTTPWGEWKDPYTRFSGYHGYWPIYNTKLDNRFGTEKELRELLKCAHAHNMNVVLDYVANHMHIESPTLKEHPTWITDSILPDGRRNFELWDEARLTTWFDVHIPSLDLEREEVCDAMTDTALYWVRNFEFDGYRHDACKHIPLNYWRMFTRKMKQSVTDRPLWMIGETYGNAELISSYVKTGMLNAQFDFNIYHTAIDVFGKQESMKNLARTIEESCRAYGDHHTMGNISGNHDKTRFISLAGGAVSWDENDKAAGWKRQIGVTADGDTIKEARAFKKAMLLEVLNLTIPGIPCIYQGDEYAQCGANDPDNRRMMRFDGLNSREEAFRREMAGLISLHRHSMPLMYGDYNLLYLTDDVMVYSRTYLGEVVIIGLNNSEEDVNVQLEQKKLHIPANGYVIR